MLEGALIFWLPRYLRLVKHRHPWQRTYKKNKLATWEIDEAYCDKVSILLRILRISLNIIKTYNKYHQNRKSANMAQARE